MTSKRSTARWIALIAVCVLSAADTAPAVAAKSSLSCSYVEEGPPGPAGNLLEIDGSGDVVIAREGEEIAVASGSSGYGLRAEPPLTCADEIELSLEIPRVGNDHPRVFVLGAPDADFLVAGDLSGGQVGIDLNRGRATVEGDVDLRISAPRAMVLQLDGGDGVDRLTTRGGPGFVAPLSLRGVSLRGGAGADLILGGARVEHIEGGTGDDTVRARGGGDFVYAGAGRDFVRGEGGNDWIRNDRGPEEDAQHDLYLGGPGNDYIASRLGGRDEVYCGHGFDEAWVDPFDAWAGHGCDKVQVAKVVATSR